MGEAVADGNGWVVGRKMEGCKKTASVGREIEGMENMDWFQKKIMAIRKNKMQIKLITHNPATQRPTPLLWDIMQSPSQYDKEW